VTTNGEVLLAWIAIGLAGSIAGWIWPFRRGLSGIVINAVAAMGGAVVFGLLGCGLGFYTLARAGTSLLFAAIGCVVALLLAHLVWARLAPTLRRSGP
jgi:uncharacterized membrane protein YeaQ/YmgE (transglycosylase-associated protein family)